MPRMLGAGNETSPPRARSKAHVRLRFLLPCRPWPVMLSACTECRRAARRSRECDRPQRIKALASPFFFFASLQVARLSVSGLPPLCWSRITESAARDISREYHEAMGAFHSPGDCRADGPVTGATSTTRCACRGERSRPEWGLPFSLVAAAPARACSCSIPTLKSVRAAAALRRDGGTGR